MIQFELVGNGFSLQGQAQFNGEGSSRTVSQYINVLFKASNNPYEALNYDRSILKPVIFLYSELGNAEQILNKAAKEWLETTYPNIK